MLVLAILPKYKTLKKYNLQSLCGENDKGDDSDGDEAAPKKVVKLSDLIKQKAEADKLGGKQEEKVEEEEDDQSDSELKAQIPVYDVKTTEQVDDKENSESSDSDGEPLLI